MEIIVIIDLVKSVNSSAAIVNTPTEFDVTEPMYSIAVNITK
jgi:hypothetical protein